MLACFGTLKNMQLKKSQNLSVLTIVKIKTAKSGHKWHNLSIVFYLTSIELIVNGVN